MKKKPLASKGEYYLINHDYAYGGGCGGEGGGLETFPNLQTALESQLNWLKQFDEDDFYEGEFEKQQTALTEAIRRIELNGCDEDGESALLCINGSKVGYNTLAAGYWERFAPEALEVFREDLEQKINEQTSEDEDDDQDDEDDDEDECMLDSMSEELAAVKTLQARKDLHSDDYVMALLSLGSSYEERHI